MRPLPSLALARTRAAPPLLLGHLQKKAGASRRLASWTTWTPHLDADITPIGFGDADYSALLKAIHDPPPVLYAQGDLALLNGQLSVAIIGTRNPIPKAAEAARRIAAAFAQRGACVVSGLAVGVDAAAHQGALDGSGPTIAVLANPLDTVHPPSNRPLAKSILEGGGLLISEMALSQPSFKGAFVRRDRIQSGLSAAVIPVQTKDDGGTMHTVHFAIAQSRSVLWPRWPAPLLNRPDFSGNRQAFEHKERMFDGEEYDALVAELRTWQITKLNESTAATQTSGQQTQ